MILPGNGDIPQWTLLFGQNLALGVIVIALLGIAGSSRESRYPRLRGGLVGFLFGACAILSMTDPIQIQPGVILDMRNIFVLVGALYGGPAGAIVATALPVSFRIYLGGAGVVSGTGGIAAAGVIGALISHRFAERVREFGILHLALIGFADALATVGSTSIVFAIKHLPPIPVNADIAVLIVYPLAAVLLGTLLSMTHYRNWRLAQNRLAEIAASTSDVIWETDAFSRLKFVSGRFTKSIGLNLNQIQGAAIRDLGWSWQDQATEEAYQAAYSSRQAFENLHAIWPTADGRSITLAVSGRPYFDKKGAFLGYRGTSSDVTERNLMAEVIRRNHERLLMAQSVGKLGYIEVDIRTGKSVWSEEFFKLCGLDSTTEPSFETLLSLVHPDDRERLVALRDQTVAGLQAEPGDFRLIRPDGAQRWLHRQSQLFVDDRGNPSTLIATWQDITEFKQLTAELADHEEKLLRNEQHLINALRVGKMCSREFDLRTGQSRWSAGAALVLGRDPENEAEFFKGVHPDDLDGLLTHYDLAKSGTGAAAFEYRLVGPDGQIKWMYRQTEFGLDRAGNRTHLFVTHQDISDLKKSEEERLALQQLLFESQKMEALGRLAGGIAHDFNNVLGAILGFGQFLIDDLVPGTPQAMFADRIVTAGKRGRSLVRQILAFARRDPVELTEVPLAETIAEACELLAILPESTNLVIDNSAPAAIIVADKGQLVQVLVNLCVNASDALAGEPGTIRVTAEELDRGRLELARLESDAEAAPSLDAWNGPEGTAWVATGFLPAGGCISLRVTDSGSGIPERLLRQIFEPFFTTKPKGQGTGLGLAVVQGIITSFGGGILVNTEEGAGTSFEVILPRSEDGAPG
jgi:PAS domain S-box-containing protein